MQYTNIHLFHKLSNRKQLFCNQHPTIALLKLYKRMQEPARKPTPAYLYLWSIHPTTPHRTQLVSAYPLHITCTESVDAIREEVDIARCWILGIYLGVNNLYALL